MSSFAWQQRTLICGGMRRRLAPVRSAFLVALATASHSYSQTLSGTAPRGDELSTIYGISDIDEAATATEKVRVYSMAVGNDLERETLVLQVAADGRPYTMRRAVVVWDIGDVLRSVESVAIVNDIVTIKGVGAGGRRQCRYAFSFARGELSKELTMLGCESDP